MRRLWCTLIPALATAAVLLPMAALAKDDTEHHHASTCTFYPELQYDDHHGHAIPTTLAWARSDLYDGHGSKIVARFDQSIASGPSPWFEFSIPAEPGTPEVPVSFAADWKSVVSFYATWTSDVAQALPAISDVQLEFESTVRLGHDEVGSGGASVTVRPGVFGPDGIEPFSATGAASAPSTTLHSVVIGYKIPPSAPEGTMDQLRTDIQFRLADAEVLPSPGRLEVVLLLQRPDWGGSEPVALTLLQVGGDCGDHDAHGGGHGAHAHEHTHDHHDAANDGCVESGACDLPAGTPCLVLSESCDQDAEESLTDATADAAGSTESNAASVLGGIGWVTAAAGVAGLTCFRPRRP